MYREEKNWCSHKLNIYCPEKLIFFQNLHRIYSTDEFGLQIY